MKRHHLVVRVTHWVNVVALTIMVASGLRIFNAYPRFAPRGGTFCCYPFEGQSIPDWLTFGGWLAGARNWHFAMMWVLVVNGLVYLGWLYLHGEWRTVTPRRGDLRDAWQMARFYLFLRPDHPPQGKHNALQRLSYFAMPLVGVLAVLTGLAVWKPTSLGWLTAIFGGYVWARYWHFVAMLALVAFSVVHVFMVISVDPWSMRAMITGGYDESRSPAARNARPFMNLWKAPAREGREVGSGGGETAAESVAGPGAIADTGGAAEGTSAGVQVAPPGGTIAGGVVAPEEPLVPHDSAADEDETALPDEPGPTRPATADDAASTDEARTEKP